MKLYIKETADKYGLRLNDVILKAGYKSQPSFSRQINNPETINMKTLIRIAEAIGCEVGEFFVDPNKMINQANINCPHCGKALHIEVS